MKTIIFVAIATFTTALPNPNPPFETMSPDDLTKLILSIYNITATFGKSGTYNPLGLTKRDDDIPPECVFAAEGNEYRYTQMHPEQGTACFGYIFTPNCGNGDGVTWGEPNYTDLQSVVTEQIAKDGQFETSRVGNWFACFRMFTTAFSNRDTSLFSAGLAFNDDARALTYYYSRDGDFMHISKENECS